MKNNPRKGISLTTCDKIFYPKKRLGQNFLVDPNVKKRIISACNLTSQDTVLEIGPGLGAISEPIISKVKKYIAVELDQALVTELKEKYKSKSVEVYQGDFLKFDMNQLPKNLKIIGNLPYYISTPIIEKIFKNKNHCNELYLTIQLELGQRITAKPHTKSYGSFTCFVQYFAKPEMLFKIKSTAFRPIPKVQSCFLKLTPYQTPPFNCHDEKFLFQIIQKVFQQRRKTIQKSLEQIAAKEQIHEALSVLKISPKSRAENLSLEDFVDLSNQLGTILPNP